jgi:hypothetical protein
MRKALEVFAAAVLLAAASSFAVAQQTSPTPKSNSEMRPPQQGPSTGSGKDGVGSRPIGPPDTAIPAPGKNPTGESKAKRKSEEADPNEGGKKQ